jgi:hypothetical protein
MVKIDRRDMTVVRMVESADDFRRVDGVSQIDQRPQLLDLCRADHVERHADGVRGAAVFQVFVETIATRGETQVAGDVKTDLLPRLLRQPLVQVDRVLVQLPDRIAHVE